MTNAAEKREVTEDRDKHAAIWARAGLIGGTGFVGGNLLAQRPFARHYSSTTIPDIAGSRIPADFAVDMLRILLPAIGKAQTDLYREACQDPERDFRTGKSAGAATKKRLDEIVAGCDQANVPFSRGGTSMTAANVQLLCARHNLEKRDSIV